MQSVKGKWLQLNLFIMLLVKNQMCASLCHTHLCETIIIADAYFSSSEEPVWQGCYLFYEWKIR